MTEPSLAAVVLTQHGANSGPLRNVVDRLAQIGVGVSVVEELDDVKAVVGRAAPERPPVVFVHLVGPSADHDEVTLVTAKLRAVRDALPGIEPVVLTAEAGPALMIACLRAGAGDLIDLALEGITQLRQVVGRVGQRQATQIEQATQLAALRAMVEELLRDLIRTERRSIDLEEQLARKKRRTTGEFVASVEPNPDRLPTVVIIEDDREVADLVTDELEKLQVATYSYVSGEEAIREIEQLIARGAWFDLALVDVRLPGIDGIETIRRLRRSRPGLSAFLMTGYNDPQTAATAADIGVVGFVKKPFDDVLQLVGRVATLARESMQRRREQLYLRRIKERHEDVLMRYRQLAAELELDDP
jgi:DNA-binding NtrC family response regulator